MADPLCEIQMFIDLFEEFAVLNDDYEEPYLKTEKDTKEHNQCQRVLESKPGSRGPEGLVLECNCSLKGA